ncbi:MAG: c-type cytochrome [Flavobacteriaceae bacterium]|nr:MAG: c-type cytochrome [Flavobacteriaceae bacterium]
MSLAKKISYVIIFSLFLVACGKSSKKEQKSNTPYKKQEQKKSEKKPAKKSTVLIDMDNKGIGPVKSLKFKSLDSEMADKGKTIFKQKCVACHRENKRLIGPAMKGIYDRRAPEWVMNMMLNPTEMLKKDPIAIAQLKEYNNVIMIDQNLSEEDARALAEYFRTL